MSVLDASAYREQIEAALERDDPIELSELILDVTLESEDGAFAENCCALLARHRNASVPVRLSSIGTGPSIYIKRSPLRAQQQFSSFRRSANIGE